ncbi:hypothetical protein KCP69_26980 (plasmid) [Salmonella enterica subsp. enterica]|nr:hypothetical protein KCP69_26980 [Salmonella enterica subsp. enterica]
MDLWLVSGNAVPNMIFIPETKSPPSQRTGVLADKRLTTAGDCAGVHLGVPAFYDFCRGCAGLNLLSCAGEGGRCASIDTMSAEPPRDLKRRKWGNRSGLRSFCAGVFWQ